MQWRYPYSTGLMVHMAGIVPVKSLSPIGSRYIAHLGFACSAGCFVPIAGIVPVKTLGNIATLHTNTYPCQCSTHH